MPAELKEFVQLGLFASSTHAPNHEYAYGATPPVAVAVNTTGWFVGIGLLIVLAGADWHDIVKASAAAAPAKINWAAATATTTHDSLISVFIIENKLIND